MCCNCTFVLAEVPRIESVTFTLIALFSRRTLSMVRAECTVTRYICREWADNKTKINVVVHTNTIQLYNTRSTHSIMQANPDCITKTLHVPTSIFYLQSSLWTHQHRTRRCSLPERSTLQPDVPAVLCISHTQSLEGARPPD